MWLAREQLVPWDMHWCGRAPAARGYPSPASPSPADCSEEHHLCQGIAGAGALAVSLPEGMFSEAESLFL